MQQIKTQLEGGIIVVLIKQMEKAMRIDARSDVGQIVFWS